MEAWLERAGLVFSHGENELHRPLNDPATTPPLPNGIRLLSWDDCAAEQFFRAYSDAFRDRPGFPGWSEAVWRTAFSSSPAFRPELSFVALAGTDEAGFILCHVEPPSESRPDGEGWIVQMGVCPAWRRNGLGAALIGSALERFYALGLARALLEVNVNNPAATRLYERMGFTPRRCWRSFRKRLDRT